MLLSGGQRGRVAEMPWGRKLRLVVPMAWPFPWMSGKVCPGWHRAWVAPQIHANISLKRYRLVSRLRSPSHGRAKNYSWPPIFTIEWW